MLKPALLLRNIAYIFFLKTLPYQNKYLLLELDTSCISLCNSMLSQYNGFDQTDIKYSV